ncbi:hypothetical protein like AT1G44130 [Hibiscus trionum]|uniref:Aspartic proteinase Asp1 n=1 Tax=Hibiscus trionum TaxID=183268 RepID=A0A9W7LV59_HIBTR|nr:hypothetical protein like AT1G44130 [Hibiscus trionum]
MADQNLKGRRRVSLMIFLVVLSASLHVCFAEIGHSQPPKNTSTLHPTDVNTFGSSVVLPVSGNVYPLGSYSVTVEIGNPPKQFQLDIDTGSDYAWVQCYAPCVGCTLPPERRYKPATDNYVLCKDPICSAFQSSNPPQCSRNPNEKCSFQIEYADHGSVSGVVVSDSFPLRLVNGTVSRPRMAFGCGYKLKKHDPFSSPAIAGVLGLGRSKASISAQLSSVGVSQNIVGHCFNDKGGFLSFGADLVPKSGMTWAPMLRSSSDNHYSLGPAEVFFRGNPTGIKGLNVIFDTGSTYTYLNSGAYGSLLNLIMKDLNRKPLQQVQDKALPICWKGSRPFVSVRDVQNYFGILALSFAGSSNIQLQLPPQTYLIVTEQGNVCLGILNGTEVGLGTTNLIGDISMQGKLMLFDNENQRIGWASADCTHKFG